jgi:hypothetical protein
MEKMDHVTHERRNSMTLGPLEYLVVGFEGNRFTGRIMPELRAAREKGIIRVVDLFLLKKDEDGNTAVLELSDLNKEDAEQFTYLAGLRDHLLTPEDVEQAAQDIPNNCSAALLLFEHTWAIGLKDAIKDAGGVFVAGGLIAPDVLKELEEELESSKQNAAQKQATAKTAS